MSHASKLAEINWTAPRSLWIMFFQFVYSLGAMIPMYYYLREIQGMTNEKYVTVTIAVPFLAGVALFMMMLLLDDFYWYREKIYLERDFFKSAMKSSFWVIFVFYVVYFLIIGRWLSSSFPDYAGVYGEDPIHRMGVDLMISFLVTSTWAVSKYYFAKYQPTLTSSK